MREKAGHANVKKVAQADIAYKDAKENREVVQAEFTAWMKEFIYIGGFLDCSLPSYLSNTLVSYAGEQLPI
ncbi:MAG: hypothetical protein NT166_18565 [Candidatus Aminicenantes bacterium]|nr:hypothetical protein [Candidatus Aminicenantes bacterium]